MKFLPTIAAVCSLMAVSMAHAEMDEAAARALLKKNDCFKCHAMDKKKDGTPYKEVAAKYRGKPDAEDKLFKHLTTNPKVKIDDKEEEHKRIKAKDDEEIRSLIRWILSL